jgi:predicted Zn finger-like uncharacterized protein
MSLATRCTACGTVFRVVQDQLKVSEGWVRCGRCKDVFNALEGLFDLERDGPPQQVAPAIAPAHDAAPLERPVESAFEPPALRAASVDAAQAQAPALEPQRIVDEALAPLDSESRQDSRDFADARFNTELTLEDEDFAKALDAPPPEGATALAPDGADEPPAFLREAARDERWQRPRVRLALGAASLLLLAGVVGQGLLHERDRIAAAWPAARAALSAACAALGCRIEPLRRIEDIAVESSSLTRAAGNAEALRLSVALRNRGKLALALPMIELSLTDAGGELVARRALSAAELRSPSPVLAPAAETSLQALLANPGGRITGYSVEVFYP